MRKIIYVSGRISDHGTDAEEVQKRNIEIARKFALKLWRLPNVYIVCPHTNSPWNVGPAPLKEFEQIFGKNDNYSKILNSDLDLLRRMDIIFMLPNWKQSTGAKLEHDCALKHNIPIYYDVDKLETFLGQTRVKRCSICKRIRKALKPELGRSLCRDCLPIIQSIVSEQLKKDHRKFIKIPRNP